MPNELPNDPSELPPPLPGQVPPPLPSASIPPPLPGAEVPPPLPGVASALPQEVPVVKPVAKPVARATPIQAPANEERPKAAEPKPVPTVLSSPAPRVNDVEHEHTQPQVKIALLVIGGILLFGCCGISVLGVAFYKLTASVVQSNSRDEIPEIAPPKTAQPELKEMRKEKGAPAISPLDPQNVPSKRQLDRPVVPPSVPPTPPAKETPAPKSNVPSPQGMDGLQAYVSFDNQILREDVSRNKLSINQTVLLFDGARNKGCRFFVTPANADEKPSFIVDFSNYLDLFRFKDDSPFTISLWVRQLSDNGVTFALIQNSLELGPKLLIKSSSRQIDVELYCDPGDSEKKFYRTKTILSSDAFRSLHHVALTRDKDGLLTVYIDAERIDKALLDSLPAKQPVSLAFKQAGFALRTAKLTSTEIDEFCLFNRSLSADEIKTLAGRDKK